MNFKAFKWDKDWKLVYKLKIRWQLWEYITIISLRKYKKQVLSVHNISVFIYRYYLCFDKKKKPDTCF